MGQRHQLFVVAKINGRYRSLAAIHHQWLYGYSALRACKRLIDIFSEPRNRELLDHEIANAETLGDEEWNHAVDWRKTTPMFPFVTTCLVVGTSFDHYSGAVSNASPEPWNMDFDQGDNNDGVTIIDISEPAFVRYCFVVFHDDEYAEEEDDNDDDDTDQPINICHTPLKGAEYLSFYYKVKKEWSDDMRDLVQTLDKTPLIPASSLNEAWPRDEWGPRIERGLSPVDEGVPVSNTIKAPALSLTRLALAKSIERILDEEDELLEDVEELPLFHPALKDYLYNHPDVVSSRRFGFAMLQKALKDCHSLDLRPFKTLSVDQIIALIEGARDGDLEMLDVSGNANVDIHGITKILSTTRVDKLYVWANPLSMIDLLRFVEDRRVKELFHPDIFGGAFKEFDLHYENRMIPVLENSAPVVNTMQLSPFGQLVYIHSPGFLMDGTPKTNRSIKPFGEEYRESLRGIRMDTVRAGVSLLTVSLHDTPLTSSGCLSFLVKFMRAVAAERSHHYVVSEPNTLLFPFAFALRNPESPHAISSIPAIPYAHGRSAYHSSIAKMPKTINPLKEGEWTVFICHDRFAIEQGQSPTETCTERLHVAFATKMADGIRILDTATFIEEAGADDFAAEWDKAISQLKGPFQGYIRGAERGQSLVEVTACDEEMVHNILATGEMFERGDIM